MKVNDMTYAEFNQLLEGAIRRPLTPQEGARLRAYLAANPEALQACEEENGLTCLLNQLPDAPLPSNFTAQVMQAVERESLRCPRPPTVLNWLGLFRPARRLAVACLLILLGGISYFQYRTYSRETMAASLGKFADTFGPTSEVAPLPAMEMLKDFDAIYLLGRTRPQADEELLAALSQVAMK